MGSLAFKKDIVGVLGVGKIDHQGVLDEICVVLSATAALLGFSRVECERVEDVTVGIVAVVHYLGLVRCAVYRQRLQTLRRVVKNVVEVCHGLRCRQ